MNITPKTQVTEYTITLDDTEADALVTEIDDAWEAFQGHYEFEGKLHSYFPLIGQIRAQLAGGEVGPSITITTLDSGVEEELTRRISRTLGEVMERQRPQGGVQGMTEG